MKYKIMVLFGVILLSLTGLCLKNAVSSPEQSLMGIAGARSLIGALIWVLFFRLNSWSYKDIFIPNLSQVIAGIAFAVTNITFTYATILTTSHNAVFLQYIAPLWIVIISFLMWKKKIEKYDFIAMPVLLTGMFFIVFEGIQVANSVGLFIGVLCGISYAFLLILLGQEKSPLSRLKTLLFGNLLTALISVPFLTSLSGIGLSSWLWILVLGTVAFGVPWIILSKALQHISPIEFAVLTMIGPVLNPVWVALAPPHEIPGFFPILGAVFVLCGVGYRIFAVSVIKIEKI